MVKNMLNLIRSDFYRMVRMKSFMIILLIIGVMNIATFVANKAVQSDPAYMEYMEKAMEEADSSQPGASDIGMSILVKSDDDGAFDLYKVIKAFVNGYLVLLFLGIFAVIFVTADFNNGYIKNYGGQLRFRTRIMCSKSICLAVFTVILFAVTVLTSCIGLWVGGAKIKVVDAGILCKFLGVELLLHMAFAVVVTAICVIVRSNLISMALCCCISMNVLNVLYKLLDKGLVKLGWKRADIAHYTVSGRIAQYAADQKMLCSTIIVAVAFFAIAMLAGGICLHKKDFV